jgi:hypothetical protein
MFAPWAARATPIFFAAARPGGAGAKISLKIRTL